ncbi:MAG: hypothetical protein GY792_36285, partial [Gammaproteobacteria bacterium]|nr:hypothetical protein [Gammaproteobacteria bacterium]
MVVDTMVAPQTDYPALFRAYVVRSMAQLRVELSEVGSILSADEQEQALHALSFALKLPEAWPETRALLLAIAPKMEQAGYRDE